MKYKILIFLSFLILSTGCSERSKLQTKYFSQSVKTFDEVMLNEIDSIIIDINNIYDDYLNKHGDYAPYSGLDKKTFLEIEEIFYSINKKIIQAKNMYSKLENPSDHLMLVDEGYYPGIPNIKKRAGWADGWLMDKTDHLASYEEWFNGNMFIFYFHLTEVGYNVIDTDLMNKGYNDGYDYDAFLKDYISVNYQALEYYNPKIHRVSIMSSDFLQRIMYVGWGFDDYNILEDFYSLIFDLYDSEDVFNYEIEEEVVRYFDHIVDYIIDSEAENIFRIHNKNLKEIGNQFNKLSSKYLRILNNKDLHIITSDNLFFNNTDNPTDSKNIIHVTSFIVNGKIAEQMMTRGYPEDGLIFLKRAISSFNSINISSFNRISSDSKEQIYGEFLSSYHSTYLAIAGYSDHLLKKNNDEDLYKENLNALYLSINQKEDFNNIFKDYKPEFYYDYFMHNTFSFLEALVAINMKYPGVPLNELPKEETQRLELKGFSLPSKITTAEDLQEALDLANLDDSTEFIIAYLATLQEYLLNNFDYDARKRDPTSQHHKTLLSAYKPEIKRLFEDVYLSDIQDNPESYILHIGLLKEFIIAGYALDLFDFNEVYKAGSMNDLNMKYLVELSLLDKIQNLLEAEDEGKVIFLEYFLDIKGEYINNEYYVNNLILSTDINIVYTVFSEGFYKSIYDYAFYTISAANNLVQIEKVKYIDLSDDLSIDTDTFIYDLEKINRLIEEKRNIDVIQKTFYDTLFKPIKSKLNDKGPIVFILDPLVETFPWEALINPFEDEWWKGPPIVDYVDEVIDYEYLKTENTKTYLFETNPITRASSLLDFFDNADYLISTKNSSTQRLNNFQNFIKLTDDIYTPRLLAVGGVDYENETKTYDVTRGSKVLSNLPWSLSEVVSINNLMRYTKLVKGRKATETIVKNQNFNNFEVLHFATHGISLYEDYKKSGLLLAADSKNDGLLSFSEIIELKLDNIDTVFLSACNTNSARILKNISSPSLQKAFKRAGSNNVISTLWVIDDRATSIFVDIYYDELRKLGTSIFALQRARKKFVKNYPEYNHPYYWAAFAHYGF